VHHGEPSCSAAQPLVQHNVSCCGPLPHEQPNSSP
jgi:hypothetical protein